MTPQSILLARSIVAGTSRITGFKDIAASLVPGTELTLRRQRDHFYDDWAIRVYDNRQRFMGYVSCEHNEIIARLLDGGKRLSAVVHSCMTRGQWNRVVMDVMLND